ncbi:MAG: HU family DNA-binding protein [Elusimicrobia bacterium]|nr:HU family DNA-binding protein [Elusimicrobiota bacterium]
MPAAADGFGVAGRGCCGRRERECSTSWAGWPEEKAVISNFGTFRVRTRRARVDRNPKTGAPVEVPPRKGVRFKASMDLAAG